MPEQVLDNTYIVAGLEQVGGKGVTKDVTGDFFGDFCLADSIIERPLQIGFMEMIAPPFTVLRHRKSSHRKKPLVDELLRSLGIFYFNGVIQKHSVVTLRQVPVMQLTYHLNLRLQFRQD